LDAEPTPKVTAAPIGVCGLVHMGQWFGLWTIAALHPVNALLLTYAAFSLSKRSTAYWMESAAAETGPMGAAPAAA
jgi:hypothetical protein